MSHDAESFVHRLLTRYHRKAIFLHRPCPPQPGLSMHSYLGGLPTLPAAYDWPHGRTFGERVPLHFVAQICCDELPDVQSGLPKTGTLFFFVRMDEEMLWGDTNNPNDDCRVIYCERVPANTPERQPPDDLPPIDSLDNRAWRKHVQRSATNIDRVYPKWPLKLFAFDSHPQLTALNALSHEQFEAIYPTYTQAHNIRVAESLQRAAGLDPQPRKALDWMAHLSNQHDFPQCGVIIEEIAAELASQAKAVETRYARALADAETGFRLAQEMQARKLKKLSNSQSVLRKVFGSKPVLPPVERRVVDPPANRDDWKRIEGVSLRWMAVAEKLGPSGVPEERIRSTFVKWLKSVDQIRVSDGRGGARPLLSCSDSIQAAMRQVVQRCGAVPALSSLIPEPYFDSVADRHQAVVRPTDDYNLCDHEVYEINAHQMLGYFPSSQCTIDADSDEVSLLHLFSDYGMDFMFCDVGEAHIFIRPEDLRARRFDKAYARTQGG